MATKKAPNTVKGKCWLDGMTVEFEGPTGGVVRTLFSYLPADKQEILLATLAADVEKRKAKEGVPE